MSELQLYLLAGGAVFIVAVIIYNLLQERRARQRAERAFGARAPDALLGEGSGEAERREPTFGALPPGSAEDAELASGGPRPANAAEELDAAGSVSAQVSSRIDTVAVILADDPVMAEQLGPLERALHGHTTPVHIEGIVDEQWHPVESSPRRSWRELRVGLQLASRKGALLEDEIEAFNRVIAEFAGDVNAVSQREAPATAAARARELDAFCADADIEVAVNVVGQSGVTFSIARVKQLALEQGLAENVSGELVRYGADGTPEFAIRRLDDPSAKPSGIYFTGLTFAMDVPHVAEGPRVLAEMVALAEAFAATLGGQLVDDNRRVLSEAGIASIRRSLERVFHEMEEHGIPAGSALARRLFS
jgi:ZipA-like protein with FtsZ-binding domain